MNGLLFKISGLALITITIQSCNSLLGRWDSIKVNINKTSGPEVDKSEGTGRTDTGGLPTDGSAGGSSGGTSTGTTSGGTSGGSGSEGGGGGSPTDSVAPSQPAGLKTRSGALAAPDTRYSSSTSLYLTWDPSTDGESGLRDYTLIWYGQSACGGAPGGTMTGLTATNYNLVGANGSTYSFKVTAYDVAGNSATSSCSPDVVVDTASPSQPAGLKTRSGALGAPDTRYASSTSIFLTWNASTDGESGLRDYTLTWYGQSSCGGAPGGTITGLTATNYNLTGTNGNTYSFQVTAYDLVGNSNGSGCSPDVLVDTTPPPAMTNVDASAYAPDALATLGTIKLTMNFPAVQTDVAKVEIRRLAGASAPTCTSGSVAFTYLSGSIPANPHVEFDDTGSPGEVFSYSGCTYDLAGNSTLLQGAAGPVKSKPHYMFATSTTFLISAFGSVAGADTLCGTAAGTSGYLEISQETHWKAILSDAQVDAKAHVAINGEVDVGGPDVLATSRADFWDGSLIIDVADENGSNTVWNNGTGDVWTGSNSDGTKHANTCSSWTNAGGTAHLGDMNAVTNNNAPLPRYWLSNGDASCGLQKSLYCISQYQFPPLDSFTAVTGTGGTGKISLSINMPANQSKIDHVVIQRLSGPTAPNALCSDGTQAASIVPNGDDIISQDDIGLNPSTAYSYRACVVDKDGNVTSSTPQAGVTSS